MNNAFINQISKGCKVTVAGLAISASVCISGAILTEQTEVRTFAGVMGGVAGTLAFLNWQNFTNVGKTSWDNLQDKLALAHTVKLVAVTSAGLCAIVVPNSDRSIEKSLNLWFLGSAGMITLTALATAKTKEQITALADIEYEDGLNETLASPSQSSNQIEAQHQVLRQRQVLTQSDTIPVTIPTQAIKGEYQEAQHYQSQLSPIADSNQPEISHDQIQQAQEDLLKIEILNTLESFKIKNSKWVGRIDGPTFIRCLIEPAPGVSVAVFTKRAEDLGRVLKLEQPPMIGIDSGAITIDIPRPDRQFVNFSDYFPATPTPQNLGGLWMTIGVDLAGNLIEINLADAKTPHVLGGGTTGGGKSALIRSMLASVIWRYSPEQVHLYLIDTGKATFPEFENIPWVKSIDKTTADGLQTLEKLVGEMDQRNNLLPTVKAQNIDEYNQKTGANLPRFIIVFEEYADFTSDKEMKSAVEEKLQRFTQLARKSGGHTLIFTQRPSAKVIVPEIRSNCPVRIGLKTASIADSKIIFGSDCKDAFYLLGDGDMLLNETKRLQSLFFDLAPTLEQYQEVPKAKQIKNPFLDYFSGKVEFVADNRQRFENFRLSLPTHPGCYLVATENHTALYVGEAENIQRRWTRTGDKAHHWIPVILELIKRGEKVFVYYLVCGDRKNKERDLVELFQTKWNGKKPEIELKNLRSGEVNYDQPKVEDVVNSYPIPEGFQSPAPGTITPELKQVIVTCKRAGWSQNRTLQELYPNIAKSSGGTYKKLVEIYQQILKEAGLL